MTDNVLEITDPVVDTQPKPGIAGAIFGNMIRDERDLPFIRLAFLLSVLFIPLAAYLFIPGNFNWWLVGVYWLLYGWFLGPYILMLHNTSHRVLFKKKYDRIVDYLKGCNVQEYNANDNKMVSIFNENISDPKMDVPNNKEMFENIIKEAYLEF